MSEVVFRTPGGRELRREVVNSTRFAEWDGWTSVTEYDPDAWEAMLRRGAILELIALLRYRAADDEVPL